MTTRTANSRKIPLLPAGLGERIRRRAVEASGIGLSVAALLGTAALLSYDAADPSWNTAGGGGGANWLGRGGAWGADLTLQSFGAAAAVLPAVIFAWGWRLRSDARLGDPWLRLTALAAALLALPAALALALPAAQWPVHGGAGGLVGGLLAAPLAALADGAGLPLVLAALPVLAAGVAAAAFASALSRREWRGIGAAVAAPTRHAAAWLYRRARRQRPDPAVAPQPQIPAIEVSRPEKTPPPAAGRAVADAPAVMDFPDAPEPEAPEPQADAPAENDPPPRDPPAATAGKPPRGEAEFRLPPLDLLAEGEGGAESGPGEEVLARNAEALGGVLRDFGVRGDIVRVSHGPVVTRYELEPAPGTRAARVIALADDIARSMSAVSARVAVIPGRNAIGIELPNEHREIVYLRGLLAAPEYARKEAALPIVLGKDISGAPIVADLGRMPHLLIAGTTGSGKSVAVNAMILSLLYRLHPEQCRMIMIDPKMLELSVYDDIPHLLHPVVTDPAKAVVALKWAVKEMNARYRLMSHLNVRNIAGYNRRISDAAARGETLERTVQTGFDPETGRPVYETQAFDMTPLPYVVVVVDEVADLMLVAGKDIEVAIQSLAQKARAAGIHLIVATQRPSVDVITGTIKANLPTRISFQVTSKIDSRTILGEQGAEQLLGMGDMLYMAGGGKVSRVHGPFVADEEVEAVADRLREQGAPDYLDSITEDAEGDAGEAANGGEGSSGDDLFDRAVALVARERKASTSFVQRHLSIGYNRAAKIIERMESEGMVGRANHVGKREVLLPAPGGDV